MNLADARRALVALSLGCTGAATSLPDNGTATLTAHEIVLGDRLRFVTDRSELLAESLPLLDSAGATLLARPGVTLEIQCHTDLRGSVEHAQSLSQDRADAIRAHLIGRGVSPERLVARGFGTSRPIADGESRRCDLIRTDQPR